MATPEGIDVQELGRPGTPERAEIMDTKIGTESRMHAGEVARIGFKA
jgi:hypothetical protein